MTILYLAIAISHYDILDILLKSQKIRDLNVPYSSWS